MSESETITGGSSLVAGIELSSSSSVDSLDGDNLEQLALPALLWPTTEIRRTPTDDNTTLRVAFDSDPLTPVHSVSTTESPTAGDMDTERWTREHTAAKHAPWRSTDVTYLRVCLRDAYRNIFFLRDAYRSMLKDSVTGVEVDHIENEYSSKLNALERRVADQQKIIEDKDKLIKTLRSPDEVDVDQVGENPLAGCQEDISSKPGSTPSQLPCPCAATTADRQTSPLPLPTTRNVRCQARPHRADRLHDACQSTSTLNTPLSCVHVGVQCQRSDNPQSLATEEFKKTTGTQTFSRRWTLVDRASSPGLETTTSAQHWAIAGGLRIVTRTKKPPESDALSGLAAASTPCVVDRGTETACCCVSASTQCENTVNPLADLAVEEYNASFAAAKPSQKDTMRLDTNILDRSGGDIHPRNDPAPRPTTGVSCPHVPSVLNASLPLPLGSPPAIPTPLHQRCLSAAFSRDHSISAILADDNSTDSMRPLVDDAAGSLHGSDTDPVTAEPQQQVLCSATPSLRRFVPVFSDATTQTESTTSSEMTAASYREKWEKSRTIFAEALWCVRDENRRLRRSLAAHPSS